MRWRKTKEDKKGAVVPAEKVAPTPKTGDPAETDAEIIGGNVETSPPRPPAAINPTITDAIIARGVLFCLILSLIANLLLANFIWQTRFEKPVYPLPISIQDKGKYVFTIPPLDMGTALEGEISASDTGTWLVAAFEILNDQYEMPKRWRDGGYLDNHTDAALWDKMKQQRPVIDETVRLGHTRNIESMNIEDQTPGMLRVSFDLITHDKDNRVLLVQHRLDTIYYEFRARKAASLLHAIVNPNPEGFWVTNHIEGTRQ